MGSPSEAAADLFAVAVIQTTGDDSLISEVNERVCILTGWNRSDLIGRSLDVLIPDRYRVGHRHYQRGYLANPTPRPMGPDREVAVLHRNGTEIPVWIGLAPTDAGGVTSVILPVDFARHPQDDSGVPGQKNTPR